MYFGYTVIITSTPQVQYIALPLDRMHYHKVCTKILNTKFSVNGITKYSLPDGFQRHHRKHFEEQTYL